MAVLNDLATYLATNSIGTVGTDLFRGFMPPAPDACVALYEYPGEPGTYVFGAGGAQIEKPRVQVIARAASYEDARSKVESIKNLLDVISNDTLSGTRYYRISALQPPFGLGRDGNDRERCAVNFRVEKAV